jgi:dolichyl-phosphate-mannose--protein O-mannosyl transferase
VRAVSAPAGSSPRHRAALAGITLAALALRAWDLPSSPPLADDLAAGASAVNLVERGQVGPTMWQHPRLRDLAIYASTAAAGSTKLGLTLPSLAAGTASVPVVALLAESFAGPAAGLVAAVLVAADSVHLGYSRQAVQEVYTFLLGALGVLLTLAFARSGKLAALALAGVAFGAGAASKWSVAFPAAASFAWLLARELRRATSRGDAASRAALVVAGLGLVGAATYLLTWTPWLLHGRDLVDLARLHVAMTQEATTHAGFNAADLSLPHRAWEWFVMPVAFADFAAGPGGPVAYVFLTNPLVWLLTLPAAALGAREAWRSGGDGAIGLIVASFAATYVPFLLASRPIWVHSALAVLPFAIALVAALVVREAGRTRFPRALTLTYLAATLLAAAPLYALATGDALESDLLRGVAERFRPSAEIEGRPPAP